MESKEKHLLANIDITSSFESHYNEKRFWKKIGHIAKKVEASVLHPILLLYYTLRDGNVSIKDKAYIIGALGYFIIPTDVIPDFIAGLGYTDDLAVMAILLKQVKDNITPQIENKVESKIKELLK
ncbi:MAG: DUF1232 domain-containing protein [Tannerella sp.]|jgi:uncharacterized membrane protein YkvA (DUF1232 family)|nr:DUF1232 domain-containing protein [Tannerella sp.]